MVLLDEGLNRLSTMLSTTLVRGQWGSNSTDPLITDTGLKTAIAVTSAVLVYSTSGPSAQFIHTVGSTAANGSTLYEYNNRFITSNDSISRNVVGGITKSTAIEVITISSYSFVRV